MGTTVIDTSGYQAGQHTGPDTGSQALWTFAIQDRKVHFWGRYDVAASTAQRFAEQYGLTQGVIRLLDCSGAWRGLTRH